MSGTTGFGDAVAGQALAPLTVEINRLALIRYAGAADDYVRQHWDHPFMIDQGYSDVIAHGWLTCAHMCRVVTNWAPPAVATIAHFAVRYVRPFHPGTLMCGGEVLAVADGAVTVDLWGKGAEGVIVARATAKVQQAAGYRSKPIKR